MRFLRLGTAGMRGEVGSGLTPTLATQFATALGTYLEGGTVVLAVDTRQSSEMLAHAARSALLSCGVNVLWAGICPAPLLHFLVPHLNADGGLLIGAGHHQAGWNALVPLGRNGAYFNAVQTQALLDIYHSGRYRTAAWNQIGAVKDLPETCVNAYLDMLCARLDCKEIAARRFKVIADFCNGAGSVLAAKFAERLGLELLPINDTRSGVLPHDPEPRPRSSTQVQSLMRHMRADAGFVFNSDMSRVAVVSSSGETLSEEYSFPLVADHLLARNPGAQSVVTNWCTTRTLDEVAARHGAKVIKTKVGQAPLIDAMLSVKACLGGDGSGSVAFGGGVNGFDGCAAMAFILEAMALRNCSSAALAEALPRHHLVKHKVPCRSVHAYSLIRNLRSQFPEAQLSEEDGIRLDWPSGWVHFRASVTEPIVRMIVEWKSREEAEDVAMQMRGLLERLVAQ